MKNCEIQITFVTQPAPKVHALLDEVRSEDLGASSLGILYARAGDFATATKLSSFAYDRRQKDLIWARYDAATPKAFLQDPRWIALWRRPLLLDWQRHHNAIATEIASSQR